MSLEHARGQSRWSLRSELAREGDEEVGRIGFGYRFPRSGERSAAAASIEARLAAIARAAEIDRSALASRFAAARAIVEGAGTDPATESVSKSRVALQALVSEGKARPSEVLPLRRQLLAAEAAEVERRAALATRDGRAHLSLHRGRTMNDLDRSAVAVRIPARHVAPFLLLPLLAACAADESKSKHDDDQHAEEAAGGHDEAGHAEGGEHEAGEAEHEGEEGTLHLEGVRGVSFAVVAEPREEGAWFAGEAISDPGAEAALSAPVSGRVTAFRSSPGSSVAAGAAVIELESPELADLAAAYLSAKARATRALRDVERERALAKSGATSARELEAAEAESAVASAEEGGARLALAGRGVDPERAASTFIVRAPRGGIVERFDVSLGETVEAGRRLGTLVAPGAALVQVELPLPGPQSWPAGAVTEARRSDGRRWLATVEGTPPALSPQTRRLSFRLRLGPSELADAPVDLPLAGTPLEVRVPLAKAVVLPQTALQQIEGVWGVFVRTSGARRRGDIPAGDQGRRARRRRDDSRRRPARRIGRDRRRLPAEGALAQARWRWRRP